MNDLNSPRKQKRVRFAPIAIVTGVIGVALLSLSMTGTLSGFVASITNSNDTAASGVLVMKEHATNGDVTCYSTDGANNTANASTCSSINKFGGLRNMVPGQSVTSYVQITNAGTVRAKTFTLTPGTTCTQSANTDVAFAGTATDFCANLAVVIKQGDTVVFDGTAQSLAGATAFVIARSPEPGATVPFTFTVTLASTADNTYEGLQASLPLTFSFNS